MTEREAPHVAAILLAGGTGSRMRAAVPKQYLTLAGQPMIRYSFDTFLRSPIIDEIIVVCGPEFRSVFSTETSKALKFAEPGPRRQDSVYNGLQLVKSPALVCVHDGARPFLSEDILTTVLHAGAEHGAAVLGLPLKPTVKECSEDGFVVRTLNRSVLWEIQTPQVVRDDVLKRGFKLAEHGQLSVTDDVSLAEIAGHPVKVVLGKEELMKITTPADFQLAEAWIDRKKIGAIK